MAALTRRKRLTTRFRVFVEVAGAGDPGAAP